MRRKTIHIKVGPTFYRLLEDKRKQLQRKVGLRKNITQTDLTELLAKAGIKFPKINPREILFKNVKRKKS